MKPIVKIMKASVIRKVWTLLLTLVMATTCNAQEKTGLWIRDYDAEVSTIRFSLKFKRQITSSKTDYFSKGKLETLTFTMSTKDFNKAFTKFINMMEEPSQVSELLLSSRNGNDKVSHTVYYGDMHERQLVFEKKSNAEDFSLACLQEINDHSSKHIYGLTWKKTDDKVSGTLYLLTERQTDYSNSIKGTPANAADFMMLFGNLRASYLQQCKLSDDDPQKLVVQTGLANIILKNCKNSSAVLSKEERALCKELINEMKASSQDKYLRGIFDLSISALGK